MMRTSCITHPKDDPFVIVRKSYVAAFGSVEAAILISYFEHWHNWKVNTIQKNKQANDIAQKHGESRNQDESLYQWHTIEEIREALLGVIGRPKILRGIKILCEKGVITKTRNPNPKYTFDNTTFFLFHPDVVESKLQVKSRNCQFLTDDATESVDNHNILKRDFPSGKKKSAKKRQKDGISATRTAIKELSEAGYVKLVSHRNEKGHFIGHEHLVYEEPQSRKPESGILDATEETVKRKDMGEPKSKGNGRSHPVQQIDADPMAWLTDLDRDQARQEAFARIDRAMMDRDAKKQLRKKEAKHYDRR